MKYWNVVSLLPLYINVLSRKHLQLKSKRVSIDDCYLNTLYYFSLLTKMMRKICNSVFLTVFGDSVLHLFTSLLASYIIVTTRT